MSEKLSKENELLVTDYMNNVGSVDGRTFIEHDFRSGIESQQTKIKALKERVDQLEDKSNRLGLSRIEYQRLLKDSKARVDQLEAICTNVGELVSTMESLLVVYEPRKKKELLQTAWHILNNTGFIAPPEVGKK